MAEVVQSITVIPRGGGFQLLEQGVPGDLFMCDVEVFRVTDDADDEVLKTRITFDGDALTLTFDSTETAQLIDALNQIITVQEPPP
jgi:hypothetical protein